LVASTSGHGRVHVSREGAFTDIDVTDFGGAAIHGIAIDSTGASVAIRTYFGDSTTAGDIVVRRNPTGAVLSSFAHAGLQDGDAIFTPSGIAAGPGGRVAIVGTLFTPLGQRTFVQLFDYDPGTAP